MSGSVNAVIGIAWEARRALQYSHYDANRAVYHLFGSFNNDTKLEEKELEVVEVD